MKLIRVIKLARVKYGDLDEGDEYLLPRIGGSPLVASKDGQILGHLLLDEVPACDTDKYPPEEVTYTIEGMIGREGVDGVEVSIEGLLVAFGGSHLIFNESEIETRYI